jgi:peptide/nickel transport system permease protein
MTTIASLQDIPSQGPQPHSAPPDASPIVRTFWQQVAHDTFRRAGARAATVWIAILIFAAVFAPLLANTQPILLKIDGHWSSPMLQFLSPPDVILFLLFTAAAIAYIFFRQFTLARRALALLILFAIATPLSYLFIHPPLTVDWQKFRDLDRAGKIQYKLMAPIPYSANDYQRDIPDAALKPPSRQHLLGTEVNGGDVLSRMIHACRIALSIGVVSTGISVIIGVTIGGLMGYFAGRLDLFGMRLIEIFEAIPTLFLLITFVAFFGRNLYLIMAIIGITGWTDEARFIRAEFLRLRKQDFVHAAVASGLPLRSILFRHLLPNGISPILVTTSFGIASAILYESVLSFLGIGLVEEPSWGQMLNQARGVGGSFVWWIALYPGLAIFLTVFTYNLLGEALRDALDPKLRT